MNDTATRPLVSTEELARRCADPEIAIVDGTYHLPTANRDAATEFAHEHLPGAIRFDIDDVCDPDSDLPHMLPTPRLFGEKVSALGISNRHHVVVYDVYGMQSAARVWWMFRVFGHERVSVLDGGLPKWRAEGRPLTDAEHSPVAASFEAGFVPDLVRDISAVRHTLESSGAQVVDVRSAGRFTAEEPEPRAGMRSGHMPGALSLPFTDLLEGPHRTYRSADDIRARVIGAGIDPDRRVVTSCGSGVTACAVALGLYLIGREDVAVYDGSWSEWGGRDDTPVVTGP